MGSKVEFKQKPCIYALDSDEEKKTDEADGLKWMLWLLLFMRIVLQKHLLVIASES